MPDLTLARHLAGLADSFQKGIRCHRAIDRFTDSHPRVKSCIKRFPPPYRRYGGILTDVYFDHFLARDWSVYCAVPLSNFIGEVYRDIDACLPDVPPDAAQHLRRMQSENWLGTYHQIAGITAILSRISRRFRKPFDLHGSLPIFEENESAFHTDFHAFFPELMAHVRNSED